LIPKRFHGTNLYACRAGGYLELERVEPGAPTHAFGATLELFLVNVYPLAPNTAKP
jgi:hypothetical protein